MKFVFDRDALLKELQIAQEIISTKNAISILSNVFFNVSEGMLLIKATDLKVNFQTSIPVDVIDEGSTTVFCDKVLGILNTLPSGEIEFEQKETIIHIKPVNKKVSFKLKSMASDKFPEFTLQDNSSYFEVPSADFKQMINQTIFAISNDETRYFMNGILFEKDNNKFVMVATDGRRLSYIAKDFGTEIDDFNHIIVPPKILNILIKRAPSEGNINIAIEEKNVFFKFGNYEFSSVLIEGQFPNYKRVIPENQTNSFEIEKKDLSEALKRVELLVEQKSRRIFFEISSGKLVINSQESELGTAKEEIPCRYDGEDTTIALNYLYVEEPLKVMDTERICFEFSERMHAITLRSEPISDYIHIIMPMQSE